MSAIQGWAREHRVWLVAGYINIELDSNRLILIGVSEISVVTRVSEQGLYGLEVRTAGGTPWANKTAIYFGVR